MGAQYSYLSNLFHWNGFDDCTRTSAIYQFISDTKVSAFAFNIPFCFFFVFVVFALEYFLPYLTVETPLSCHLLSGRPLY